MMKSRYVKVDGHTGFVRDTRTNSVLNMNTNSMQQAIELKLKRKKEKEEFESLKQDVKEIKNLLGKLLEDRDASSNSN